MSSLKKGSVLCFEWVVEKCVCSECSNLYLTSAHCIICVCFVTITRCGFSVVIVSYHGNILIKWISLEMSTRYFSTIVSWKLQ
jgi:hypothetical protein